LDLIYGKYTLGEENKVPKDIRKTYALGNLTSSTYAFGNLGETGETGEIAEFLFFDQFF